MCKKFKHIYRNKSTQLIYTIIVGMICLLSNRVKAPLDWMIASYWLDDIFLIGWLAPITYCSGSYRLDDFLDGMIGSYNLLLRLVRMIGSSRMDDIIFQGSSLRPVICSISLVAILSADLRQTHGWFRGSPQQNPTCIWSSKYWNFKWFKLKFTFGFMWINT